MASKTEVCNRALIKLGQFRVSNVDTDPTSSARVLSEIYLSVLYGALQTFPWNFSIKRTDLSASTEAVSWGVSKTKYPLPADCLQLLEIYGDPDYSVENGNIICDETGVIYVKYISKIEDAGEFPPIFVEFFSSLLAIESCERITGDKNLKQLLLGEHRTITDKALRTDSVENLPVDPVEDDWIKVRK